MKRLLFIPKSLSFKLYLLLVILLVISFSGIMYFNISSYIKHINESVINSAIQASDLIKRSTRYSMLKNDRENLSQIIKLLVKRMGLRALESIINQEELHFQIIPMR